jgi:peptidoglycan hydrolase CwlO-like protein
VAALLAPLLATVGLTVVLVPRPAAADQIADLKAHARAIAQDLIQEQLQIDAYQQQYSVVTEKVAADGRTVATIDDQISRDKRKIDNETNAVRKLAILSYMDAGNALTGSDAVFTGNIQNISLANEYTSLSAGDIDTALDQLQTAQRTLQVHQATLLAAQTADRSEQTVQANALAQAVSTEHQMESEQAQVTGQLATLVAAQAVAQARAAAAAEAAARQAAAAAASTTSPSTTSPSTTSPSATSPSGTVTPPSGPISDPTLNPYLQCVLMAESGGNYAAVSPNGLYLGGFQFSQATWNMAAPMAGLPGFVGVPPNLASKAAQDTVAVALYALDGQRPWLGDRCSSS